MAKKIWIANASAVAQITTATPANVGIGDKFILTINEKDVSFIATAATAANVIAGLIAAVNASQIEEFREVIASEGTDANGQACVLLTSRTAGIPFTVTASTVDASGFAILVTTLQHGGAGVNEIKTVTLAGIPTGGTFTLTQSGFAATSAQAFNESAANLQTDLETAIGAGDVAVTRDGTGVSGDPYIWTIEFQGALAGTNVGAMTGDGSSLTGAAEIDHLTVQEGGAGANEIQTITQPDTDGGTYNIQCDSLIGPFNTSAPASDLQDALEVVYGVGSVTVTMVYAGGNYTYTIRWLGAWAATNIGQMSTQVVSGTVTNTHATVQDGSATPVNEVQHIRILHGPDGGTWDLTFQGQTAAGLAHNISAAALVTALEALSNIGVGDVAVTKTGSLTEADPAVYEVTFQGAWAATDVDEMTSDATSLTGSDVLPVTTTQGSAGNNEIQRVEITGGTPAGGTFTLTQDYGAGDETTAALAYNASAAAISAAIVALTTPVAGDVNVTGAAGGPWTIEYQGAFAATDFDPMTGNAGGLTGVGNQTLTIALDTAATGPEWWSNVDNWDTGAVPVDTDEVYFQGISTPCRFGLEQSAVTLASLNILGSYNGQIGLKRHNGSYYEYRTRRLEISATLVNVGTGDGGGPTFLGLDTGADQVTGNAVSTSGGSLTEPAIDWIGTHASNAWTIGGQASFSAALYSAELATILTLNQSGNAIVVLGPGVTLDAWNKKGGTGELNNDATTIIHDGGGTLRIYAGTVGTLDIRDGTVIHNSMGTITTLLVSDGGRFDKREDSRLYTITNTSLYSGAAFVAPHGNTTFTNPYQLVQCGYPDLNEFDLGSNISGSYANI